MPVSRTACSARSEDAGATVRASASGFYRCTGRIVGRMREWAATAPLWQLWAYFFFAWTLMQMVLTLDQAPIGSIVGGIAFASVMTVVTSRRRKRDASAAGGTASLSAVRQMDRAIETGQVPADPSERAALRGLVERRLTQSRFTLWFGSVVFGLFTLLGLTLLITTHSVSSVIETVVFVFFLVWGPVAARRQRAKAEAVRRMLDGQELSSPAQA